MTDIVIPASRENYFSEMRERCETLISAGIWNIKSVRLRAWLKNFDSPEAQYLCAHLLDALSFRNHDMTTSLCDYAANVIFPNIISKYPESIDKWSKKLLAGRPCDICFVAVEGVGKGTRKPAKSGQLVLRQYERSEVVNKVHFVDADALINLVQKRGYKTVVFIDDFCGTGTQFKEFFDYFEYDLLPAEITKIYIPFSAHQCGIDNLRDAIPSLKLHPVEKLSEDNNFFFERNGTFRGDGRNSSQSMREFYLTFLESKGLKTETPFGFGDLALSWAYFFSTPNNILPIYYQENSNWQKLLKR